MKNGTSRSKSQKATTDEADDQQAAVELAEPALRTDPVTDQDISKTEKLLRNSMTFSLEVTNPCFTIKLTKAEKEMLFEREQKAAAARIELEQLAAEQAIKTAKKQHKKAPRVDISAAPTVREHNDIRGSKDIINIKSPKLRAVRARTSQFTAWLKQIEFYSTLIGSGRHLIPLDLIGEVNDQVDRYITERAELVEIFLAEEYPRLKQEQMELDPELYREADYPTVEQLREKFGTPRYEWISDELPIAKLSRLSDAQLRKTLEKSAEKWRNVGDEFAAAMRHGLGELVGLAVEQLGSDDGKHRVFRDSMIEKINLFIRVFETKNDIINDDQLPAMVEELRQAMQGVTPETLRKNEDTRRVVKEAFDKVASQMTDAGMVVVRRRVIKDDPDEMD